MCRIAGIIDFSNPNNLNKIAAMRDCMYRGGPDDGGQFADPEFPIAFGVRRLALVDLSQNGHQPMSSPDGDTWISFNGEIYNFREIRGELKQLGHSFHSGTDTEVVLLAWKQWGVECFDRFNGMFGLCIWDKKKQQIILARDHAGMKPLYYFLDTQKKQLFFASEVRAFKQVDNDWPEDPAWRVNLLGYGHLPEPSTTLKNVFSLAKGKYMVVDIPGFSHHIKQWYKPFAGYNNLDKTDAQILLRKTLDKAVLQQLLADAPVGLFLSGGIDSSILTTLAARHIPENLTTLSITFNETAFSEKYYQDILVNQVKCRHHAFNISQALFEESMPDILEAMDQPSNDGINTYLICKYARATGIKAVLSGIGADELLGGYNTADRRKTAGKLRRLPARILGLAANISDDRLKRIAYLQYGGRKSEYLFYRGFYTPDQIAQLLQMDEKEVEAILVNDRNEKPPAPKSSPEYVSDLETDFYMQNQLLRDTDCMSMWHSVEVRMPFLDRNVMELIRQTDPAIRFEKGRPKKWLVDVFKDSLPNEIWNRKKMGFIFPFNIWFRNITVAGACDQRFYLVQKRFLEGNIKWSRYWAWLLCMQAAIRFKPTQKKVLFVTLKTFSFIGGIEKFNRLFSMALQQNAVEANWQVSVISLWDKQADQPYFPAFGFRGFNRNIASFALAFFRATQYYNVIIAGHINLSPFFLLSKLRRRKAKLLLVAHGIEVWQPLTRLQKKYLQTCNAVWCVSRFTAATIENTHQVPAGKSRLFPNTIDPYFIHSATLPGIDTLRRRYSLPAENKIIITITRLASTEKYKGYDEVLRVLPSVMQQCPNTSYLLCGRADEAEEVRIKQIVKELNLQQAVILTGFIEDEELKAHYNLGNTFVMPSRKEGFGIVFIEAAWLGLQVIAGNQDGSADAMLNGQLGELINPGDKEALENAIVSALKNPLSDETKSLHATLVTEHFGFAKFKERQLTYLNE
jgi:asparagine synthase (glutamine-hydrolysing)